MKNNEFISRNKPHLCDNNDELSNMFVCTPYLIFFHFSTHLCTYLNNIYYETLFHFYSSSDIVLNELK